ncbi:metallophosphoesterase [Streptomyces sp. 4F14]|uniref:metallophosphoesterase n=1 Tax=Streptomyces sp. 4F14 TaxID=3394380 RepID=UPI003A88A548
MRTAVVATCDFHSSVPGGNATLAALARHREAGALVIDAGDFFGGNAFHEYSQGAAEEQILRECYDAVVPGNHDLADLMRLRDPQRFPPVVCCNLRPPSGFGGRWENGLLLPAHGLRVGMVGFIGAQAYEAVPAAERAGFTFQEVSAELLAAERDRLLSLGADVVIGVSHSGFQHDVALQESGLSPFDLIVAAHCHREQYHWTSGPRHVVKAPELGAGLLRIDFDGTGAQTFTTEYHPPAAGLAGPGAGFLPGYGAWGAEIVGRLATAVPDRTVLAWLLAAKARTDSGTDAFLLNLPTLRAGLPRTVTRGALADAVPFDTALVRLAGEHDTGELVRKVKVLGEEPVFACAFTDGHVTVATTAYLADRLGIPHLPVVPRTTLRSTVISLTKGAA